jgi:phage terminase large subunit GpA-like protein
MDTDSPLISGFFGTFKVHTSLTVTQWADEYRILPSKGSAAPGKYRSERTPYMREVMDCLSVSSPVEETVLMAGAQTGKSESGNNWVGYVIDNAPGPMLLVQPTVDNAKRYSKQRITPMILETPSLAEKIVDNKSRESGNTMLEKEFPNGILLLGGANSAAGLRSMPIRYLFADEISNWPADVDGEGDPLGLAEERTNTFGRKRKIFKCSTPGVTDVCRIETEYLKTDQRRYFVPCPHCGHMHILDWSNFHIPRSSGAGALEPENAYMACPDCGGLIHEHHKTDFLRRGEWRATCPEKADATRRGYKISALYSPVGWKSWAKIARQWIEAQGNQQKLQAFCNNVLAETWSVKGESVSDSVIHQRVQSAPDDYDGRTLLPEGVLLITNGVDTQQDRLELETIGWGQGEESWSIEYRVFMGDPNGALVWQQLDAYLATEFNHPSGVRLRAARTFVDTAGANTQAVYDYVRDRSHMGVFGIKGRGGDGIPAVGTPSRNNLGKVPLVPLGTFVLKDSHYGALAISEPGAGYCHFPKRYSASYYKGLTAEEVQVKLNTKGFPVREWFKKYERNEPLDCRVYGKAAMLSLNVNFEHLAQVISNAYQPEDIRRMRGELGAAA